IQHQGNYCSSRYRHFETIYFGLETSTPNKSAALQWENAQPHPGPQYLLPFTGVDSYPYGSKSCYISRDIWMIFLVFGWRILIQRSMQNSGKSSKTWLMIFMALNGCLLSSQNRIASSWIFLSLSRMEKLNQQSIKKLALYLYILPNSALLPGFVIGNLLQIFQLCTKSEDINIKLEEYVSRLLNRGHQQSSPPTLR
ncbi:hypothetical protein ACHAXR_005559, partial [Thalassiosira sp. AJA248-18]